MKNIILPIILALLFLSGCNDKTKLRVVSNVEKADVFVDGDKKGNIRIGYAPLLVSSGEHEIMVKKVTSDGEWIYEATATVDAMSDVATVVEVDAEKKATEKRKKRLVDQETQAKKEKELLKQKMWNSTETYTDNKKGIVWKTSPAKWRDQINELSHKYAKKYCEDLEFANSKDWRLPTKYEAYALGKSNNKYKFKDTQGYYWTSSLTDNGKAAYYMIAANYKSTDSLSQNKRVYCVSDIKE